MTVLYCSRSGLPLADVTVLCSMGQPMVGNLLATQLIHPIYDLPLDPLLVRARKLIVDAEAAEWLLPADNLRELSLCMSAILYSLDVMWLPAEGSQRKVYPSLPALNVTVGTAARLIKLAHWYHHATSKRMTFPQYHVSKQAGNTEWQNFSGWVDAAYEIKASWSDRKEQLEAEELKRSYDDALKTVRAESIYSKLDMRKVWNWIDIQLAISKKYPLGRRTTFKTLFMDGNLEPSEWLLEDLEDLQLAIMECCDVGNDVMFFVNKRVANIRAVLLDFYGGFTLLTRNVPTDADGQPARNPLDALATPQEQAMMQAFDDLAAGITELPPEPQRASYPTLGTFLKARAEWTILSKRFNAQPVAPVNAVNAVNTPAAE